MNNVGILAKFFQLFPQYMSMARCWTQTGANSVGVALSTGQVISFEYINEKDWSINSCPRSRYVV